MKKVLVTGAAGFIGRNLVEKLLAKNVETFAVVMPGEESCFRENEKLFLITGDLGNIEEVERKIGDITFDTLFHLAWKGVSTSCKNEFDIQIQNIAYAMNVMKMAQHHKCNRVIMTGSVSEYAYCPSVDNRYAPMPSDFYSVTKACVHLYCDFFTRLYKDISLNWAVISSIYGPGRNDDNVITYTIKALISGSETKFTKSEQIWDYVYITDVIRALILIAEKGVPGKMYQIGSGIQKPLYEYLSQIKDEVNPEAVLGFGKLPYKTKQIDNSIVDITALREDTGYYPMTDFEAGIKETISYFRKRGN